MVNKNDLFPIRIGTWKIDYENLSAIDFTMETDDYKRLNEFRNKDFDNVEIDWYYKGGITIDQLANQFE